MASARKVSFAFEESFNSFVSSGAAGGFRPRENAGSWRTDDVVDENQSITSTENQNKAICALIHMHKYAPA